MDTHQEFGKLVKICQSNLKNSKECINYLIKERGLEKRDVLENKLGFFPQNISILKNQ